MKRTLFLNGRLFTLTLFIISLSVLSAQQTLTGLVFDSSTSEALEGANVVSRPSGVGTSTGASGRFALEINQGDSVLVVEHIAFERSVVNIKNLSVEMRIGLSEKIISLSELDVIGETGRGEFSQLETKNMVSDITVSDISIRSYSDIGDVLLNEESVIVSESSTGAKTLSIRGARQEEMIYMYDGVKMQNGGRRSLDLSMFDVGGLETVEVLRGSHENASGSSGTINFVPKLSYGNGVSFYQRFGTYNTGSYYTGLSLGSSLISLDYSAGQSVSRQFYESSESADILRESTNQFISAGYRPGADTEIKLYQIKSGRMYNNHYNADSIGSTLMVNTLKIEHKSERLGQLELYVSEQKTAGEDDISQLKTDRDDGQVITGLSYKLPIESAYIELFLDRSTIAADWGTSLGDIALNRQHLSFSGVFGISQNKTRKGFEIKEFVVNINSNIIEDNGNNKSILLNNRSSWKESGATASVSAWDHLDVATIYLFANIGNNFRVPSINERYAHALRPQVFSQDSLVIEYKIMKEVGAKISSRDSQSSPRFSGSVSYFSYGYTDKIKTIQYSGSPLQFPVNFGSAEISGLELNMEVLTLSDMLSFRSIYSSYNYSDQLSFPMQPIAISRNSVGLNIGALSARVAMKNEGGRVLTTVSSSGRLTDNYLKEHQSLDVNISYKIKFRDLMFSIAIFGQNLNDDSQSLDGVSIYDKRLYLSMGIEWK
ncbi:MAG: hypothetical protein CMG41_02575 [Candidatus Marinimicrobia bacterium]|nr:hypothetical protein [Candidatus Neomarinimicrobiota bacterium]